MKKKTMAFMAGTMILGTILSGCGTKEDNTQTMSIS